MKNRLYPRAIDRLIARELLPAFPAILLVGPRGTGKSTSMTELADTVLDLSIPGVRLAASEDPDGILASLKGTVLIDEWQEVPDILGAVKRAVDQDIDNAPGRFIVTGSVRAAHQSATWPGTGRLIRVRMYGLTQSELERNVDYNPIDALFAAGPPTFGPSNLSRNDYIKRMVSGRFPAVLKQVGRNRSLWFSAYVDQLFDKDVPQISERANQPSKVRSVLYSCAARTGLELNKQATANDADVDFRTANRTIELLEDLSIVFRIPAWHTKRIERLNRSPKIYLSDPGMAAYLLSTGAATLGRDPALVGQMFETFVAAELVAHLETTEEETKLFHLRDRDGREVDAVLERNGSVVALEVKSSTKVDRRDARELIWLRDRLGSNFHNGAILYSGTLPFKIEDRIWALPLSTLWRSPR